jgi:dihydrolipoamide dehydrogenase
MVAENLILGHLRQYKEASAATLVECLLRVVTRHNAESPNGELLMVNTDSSAPSHLFQTFKPSETMKQYDMLVLGSGAGANVASDAYEQGMTVAIVDNDRFGGTCLNRGCIPTKILTYVADLIMEIRNAERVNLKANVEEVDFSALMTRMRHETWDESEEMERSFGKVEGYDFYKGTGEFVGPYTMDVNNERIKAQHVVIASGARPVIPNVPGLEKVQYFTNKTILELDDIPKSMIIIGGGFIAVEFGHFFSAIGTEVTILQRAPSLIVQEDNDVSELLRSELSKRMRILLNNEVVAVGEAGEIGRAHV